MSNLSGFVKRIRNIMRNDAGINGDAQRIEQMAWLLFLKVYDTKEQDWDMNETGYESIIPEACRWCNWAVDHRDGNAMTGDTLLEFINNILFPVLKGKDVTDNAGNKIEGIKITPQTPIKKAIVRTTFEDANQYMKDGVLLRQIINIIDDVDLTDYEESHAFGFIYESILKELQSAGSAGEYYTPRAVTDFMAKMIQPKIGEKMADFACGTGGFITSWLKELETQINGIADQAEYETSIYGIEKKQFPYILCITNMLLHGLDIPNVFHTNSLTHNVLDYTEEDQFDVILMNPPYGGSEKAEIKNYFPSDLACSETADLFMAVIMYRLKKNGRAAVILPDSFLFGVDNAKINLKKKLLQEFNLHTIVRMPSSVFAPYTSITTNILFFDNTKPTEETWFYRLDMPEKIKHFSKTKPMILEHFKPVFDWWDNRKELIVDGYDKSKKYSVTQLVEEYGYEWKQCGYPRTEDDVLEPSALMQRYQEERASLNAIVDRSMQQMTLALNTKEVRQHSDIANGALKKLIEIDDEFPINMRKSMLQYAVQGRLVEQQPEEGTGEELYQQIQAEKQALIKAGRIKKGTTVTEISDDEIPFDIPDTWRWVRLGDCSTYDQRKEKMSSQEIPGDMWSLDLEDIEKESGRIVKYCRAKDRSIAGDKVKFSKDQILYSKLRPYLKKVLVAPDDGVCSSEMVPFSVYGGIDPQYIVYVLTCPHVDNVINAVTYGVKMPRVGTQTMVDLLIPLPPVAEQKRIVAKLEEILPLCDRLK